MKLGKLYELAIKKGIDADPRGKDFIEKMLNKRKEEFDKMDKKDKDFFDKDSLFNPFADTRILKGDLNCEIKSVIVGIDVEGQELILVDKLRNQGRKIDLVISHHPEGHAYANFYEVMDLQVDLFYNTGLNISLAEKLLSERKEEVKRRVSASNHMRSVDIANILGLNFMCIHTPADNLAYQFIYNLMNNNKPKFLSDVIDLLMSCPEYQYAAKNNNPPMITVGSKNSRVSKIHIEFTGGTEGPENIYQHLSQQGVDTIIAMHQSESHYKQCRQANINVVIASHIASDNLGVNLMLDYINSKEKLKIYEFSGFKRVERK